jgi:mono/diheme cytochrome c family protein
MDRLVEPTGSRMTARRRLALWALTLGVLAAKGSLAATGAGLDGSWVGTLEGDRAHGAATAVATLSQTGTRVQGIVTFTGIVPAGTFAVTGRTARRRARLAGVLGAQRWRWVGRWSRKRGAWRGVLRMRAGRGRRRIRRRLTMTADDVSGPAVQCGAEYFAGEVMPRVIEPICAQCHVAGGLAQSTRLRVTAGDPVATARTAIKLVDGADPSLSPLVLKPRAEVAHGGGQRITPGGAEEQILQQWITLVTAPGCGDGNGGGTGDPYVDNCASCHGPDARGLAGRPDIHCHRGIHDVVRSGQNGPAGEMPAFPNLSEAEIATIQVFLLELCPTTQVTGAELYASNCRSCHGTDARGVDGPPSIRCNRAIHEPVRNGRVGVIGTMPAFPAMSAMEISLVQTYLTTLCPPGAASGEDLYAGNCATCHGADAGGVSEVPSIRCATRVADAVELGRGDRMTSFPTLVGADLASLTGHLAQLCTQHGRTGADLWAGNCSTCHGVAGVGGRNGLGVSGPDIACTGANDFHEKVQNGDDEMPAFPALGSADVDAIASFVHGTSCDGD